MDVEEKVLVSMMSAPAYGVRVMDILDRLGLAEDQEVVVALLVTGAADEDVATEMILVEAEALDLGAHGAVEDEDALVRGRVGEQQDFRAVRLGATGPKRSSSDLTCGIGRSRCD